MCFPLDVYLDEGASRTAHPAVPVHLKVGV
jgi:hypothetical protein